MPPVRLHRYGKDPSGKRALPQESVVSLVAVSLGSFAIIGTLVGFAIWLARWARGAEAAARDETAVAEGLKDRVDELTRAVEDRDGVIAAKEEELVRLARVLTKTEAQRDDAIDMVQEFAADNPAATGDAIRDQLKRLLALSKVPDVPPAPTAEGG